MGSKAAPNYKTLCFQYLELEMAERVGFEPTCRFRDNTLSRRARYDHFGTSPLGKTATVAGTTDCIKRPSVSS